MARPVVIVRRRWQDFPPPTPQPTICKIWQGGVDKDGYGQLTAYSHRANGSQQKQRQRAHRWIWETANGPIPRGMVVRHKCDNRLCFRLSHLELGTVADNNRDTAERGHAGGVIAHSPSRLRKFFDEWEAFEGGIIEFAGLNPDIAKTTVRRYASNGRYYYFPEENPDGDIGHGSTTTYDDAPDGVSTPVEFLAEFGTRDGAAGRNLAAWRQRQR